MSLAEIVSWATPPVIGAIIGYVTNDIAIRMLFRPLREIRVLGLKVPFTPGIIPKERYTLSRSIARMVSQELLTEDTLRKQLHAPQAMEQLSRSVSGLSSEILDTPLSRFTEKGLPAVLPTLQESLRGILSGLFRSPGFFAAVRSLIARMVGTISSEKVGSLLDRHELPAWARGRLLPLIGDAETRGKAGREAARLLSGPEAIRPAELVSPQLRGLLLAEVENLLPAVTGDLLERLRIGAERGELERQGRILVRSIVEKLNVIQRFLVGAGQFDRRLEEKMPEIVDDALDAAARYLEDPAHVSRLAETLLDALLSGGRGPSAGRAETVQGIVEVFVRDLVGRLSDSGAWERLLDRLLEALRGGGTRTVGALLAGSLGIRDVDAVEAICFQVLDYLNREETARDIAAELSAFAARFLEDNKDSCLAKILAVDEGKKRELDAWLFGKLVGVLDQKLPEILRGIDVEGLVIGRIDGLDVRDVENLVMEVVASHLKWINVFGAILGFLIGLIQVVFRLVGWT